VCRNILDVQLPASLEIQILSKRLQLALLLKGRVCISVHRKPLSLCVFES
jgi:hypothetical protein